MANKLKLQFSGFEEYIEKLDKLGGDVREATEQALIKTHEMITPALKKRMEKAHDKYSGATKRSLDENAVVTWEGQMASINVGFHIRDGGLPSIFLMYGTPRMQPDRTLYNLVYGAVMKREIGELQKEIFVKAIKKRMEG